MGTPPATEYAKVVFFKGIKDLVNLLNEFLIVHCGVLQKGKKKGAAFKPALPFFVVMRSFFGVVGKW